MKENSSERWPCTPLGKNSDKKKSENVGIKTERESKDKMLPARQDSDWTLDHKNVSNGWFFSSLNYLTGTKK